jgi:formylglycine-generating enzyme required for sulfatase activity
VHRCVPARPAADASSPATVEAFRLDKYEVTVGRFRTYVEYVTSIGGQPPANGSGKHSYLNGGLGLVAVGATGDGGADSGVTYETGWDGDDWNTYVPSGNGTASTWTANLTTACTGADFATWTSQAGANENLPINCLGWYAAYAFCIWDGGFLPSEAEWELAAAGGSEQRNYVWGNAAPGTMNEYAIYGSHYPPDSGSCADGGTSNLAPVGTPTEGVARWGQLDLNGNVNEWTLDTFAAYVVPCVDCVNETSGPFRLMRGGSFEDPAPVLVAPFRAYGVSSAFYEAGVRCARAPQ